MAKRRSQADPGLQASSRLPHEADMLAPIVSFSPAASARIQAILFLAGYLQGWRAMKLTFYPLVHVVSCNSELTARR